MTTVIVIFGCVSLLILWRLPVLQSRTIGDVERRLTFENECRKTLAGIMAGLAVLAGFIGTWNSIGLSKEEVRVKQFAMYIEMLESDKIETKIGGIYGLESVVQADRSFYLPVMESLSSYVRREAAFAKREPIGAANELAFRQIMDDERFIAGLEAFPEEMQMPLVLLVNRMRNVEHWSQQYGPSKDVRACLTVLGRRNQRYDEEYGFKLSLQQVDLKYADLSGANLENADLEDADFSYAKLAGTSLKGANLRDVNFQYADLSGADLSESEVFGLHLHKTNLDGAIVPAWLPQTILNSACVSGKTKIPTKLKRPKPCEETRDTVNLRPRAAEPLGAGGPA